MNAGKLALVASVATIMMTAGAAAQSNMNSSAGASGDVSAATHCRDANGQVQLKSAMSGQSGSGSATTGSAASGSASGSGGSASGQTGATTPGASGSAAGTGTAATNDTMAANLPSC